METQSNLSIASYTSDNARTKSQLAAAQSQQSNGQSSHVSVEPPNQQQPSKAKSFFLRLFGRGDDTILNDEGNARRKEAFIEDALDREKTLMNVLKHVQDEPDKANNKDASSGSKKSSFSLFSKMRSKSKEDVVSAGKEAMAADKAKSMDNLHSSNKFGILSKSGSRLANFFSSRGGSKLVLDKKASDEEIGDKDEAKKEKKTDTGDVMVTTEKITKLSKANPIYVEASEVRKLKAIDDQGREHEVRKTTITETAIQLETRLEEGTGEADDPVKATVVGNEMRVPVTQKIKAAVKSVEAELEETVATTPQTPKTSTTKPPSALADKTRERSPEKAARLVKIVEHKDEEEKAEAKQVKEAQQFKKLKTPAWIQRPKESSVQQATKHHKSETDLRLEEVDRQSPTKTRSESTTKLPARRPTTIGSQEDIIAHTEESTVKPEEGGGEVAKPTRKLVDTDRLKRFFENASSGPKSLPQSMTTAHQEMKAQMVNFQRQNSMRRSRTTSPAAVADGNKATAEEPKQTVSASKTTLHETDLDAAVVTTTTALVEEKKSDHDPIRRQSSNVTRPTDPGIEARYVRNSIYLIMTFDMGIFSIRIQDSGLHDEFVQQRDRSDSSGKVGGRGEGENRRFRPGKAGRIQKGVRFPATEHRFREAEAVGAKGERIIPQQEPRARLPVRPASRARGDEAAESGAEVHAAGGAARPQGGVRRAAEKAVDEQDEADDRDRGGGASRRRRRRRRREPGQVERHHEATARLLRHPEGDHHRSGRRQRGREAPGRDQEGLRREGCPQEEQQLSPTRVARPQLCLLQGRSGAQRTAHGAASHISAAAGSRYGQRQEVEGGQGAEVEG